MKRKPALYYDRHPNAKFWRNKGDTIWSFLINQGNCAICGNVNTQAHHILTRGSYPQYRHDLMDGMDYTIDGFMAFVSQDDGSEVTEHFSDASDAFRSYRACTQ